MRIIKLLLILLFVNTANAQFTKNIKEYTTESGIHIKPGMKIKILSSTYESNGQMLWTYYGRGKMPVPKEHFGKEHIGKTYTIEKVLKMKGLKNPEDSTIILFKDGKKKCYSFIAKALIINEVQVL